MTTNPASARASNGQSSSRPDMPVAQHRHARAVAGLESGIVVDENAVELRHARLREHCQGLIAEVAVVTLIENEAHRKR